MEQLEFGPDMDDDQEQEILARLRTAADSTSSLFELQAYYKERARYEEEVAVLRQLLEKGLPADQRAETLHDLAYALYRQGNLEEAILQAEDLLRAYPDYRYLSSVFWLLGATYGQRSARQVDLEDWKQDVKAAEANLRKALSHTDDEQERAGILVELGEALSVDSTLDEARRTFEQAIAIGIEDVDILASCYQRLGGTWYQLGQVEKAKWYYEQAILVFPEQPSNSRAIAYVDLAGLCREQGDIDQAEQYCQQALQVVDSSYRDGPSSALERIYEELGDIFFQKNDYQQAVDNYWIAQEQDPLPERQEDLYYKLGIALQQVGQYKPALEFLRQALALGLSSQSSNDGHVGELLFYMGWCAYGLHDDQRAILLFEKAIEKVDPPVLVSVQLLLGHSYFRLKRFNKAAEFYAKVIRGAKFLSPSWRRAVKYYVWARITR